MRVSIRALGLATILFLSSCGQGDPQDPPRAGGVTADPSPVEKPARPGIDLFRTAVAVADTADYTPYWLGTSFEVAELTFLGPSPSEASLEYAQLSTDATYLEEGERNFFMSLQSYGPEGWSQAQEFLEDPELAKNTRLVQIGGRSATIGGHGPNLQVIVKLDLAVVVVQVPGYAKRLPTGARPSPLLDEPMLLALLENLRPYPE